jgi:hypothetical protein
MANIIKRNQFPDREEFAKLYATRSQDEMAEIYHCNVLRIRKWLLYFGMPIRSRGSTKELGPNNHKYDIDIEYLRKLVADGYSNQQIRDIFNINANSSLSKILSKNNIKRTYNNSDYAKYKNKCYRYSEKIYVENQQILNPHKYPRTLCGVAGGYQLDHIIQISECYARGYSVAEASGLANLQFIPWEDNLKKRVMNRHGISNKIHRSDVEKAR